MDGGSLDCAHALADGPQTQKRRRRLRRIARRHLHHRNWRNDMKALDLRGLTPAPVTPFTRDGAVDHAAIQRLGSWLGSINGVKGLVVLGHAGEGTFLSSDEQTAVIQSFIESVDGKIPVIAGITLEGT